MSLLTQNYNFVFFHNKKAPAPHFLLIFHFQAHSSTFSTHFAPLSPYIFWQFRQKRQPCISHQKVSLCQTKQSLKA